MFCAGNVSIALFFFGGMAGQGVRKLCVGIGPLLACLLMEQASRKALASKASRKHVSKR